MNEPAGPDYFRAVERTFLDLRGSGMFLAPSDWDLVRRWEERGIPLDAVLAGIRAAFSGRIRVSARMPLGACSREVEAAYDARRARRSGAAPSGGGEPATESRPDRGRDPLVDRLRTWTPAGKPVRTPEIAGDLVAATRDAAAKFERFRRTAGAAGDNGQARQAMEAALLARFRAALPDAARAAIESEVRNTLAPYRTRMPESTWRETFEAAVRRRVGKVFGLGLPTD